MDFSRTYEAVSALERLVGGNCNGVSSNNSSSSSPPCSPTGLYFPQTSNVVRRNQPGRHRAPVGRSLSCHYHGGGGGGEDAAEAAARRVAERLCSRVHRPKDGATEGRRRILLAISSEKELLRHLLYICEATSDSSTACFALGVLRECVAAKSLWRADCLLALVELNAADSLLKCVLKQHQTNFPDHGIVCAFWVFSALATKDPKFSSRFRLSGALRHVVPFLRRLACKSIGLYPVLQTLKALCRNASACETLGKEGAVASVSSVLRSLRDKKFCPRTKVAMEALHMLVKAKPNLHLLVENVGGCSELTLVLLDLLAQYELHMGSERLCAKIVGTILNVFLKLVSTGPGREQFKDECGPLSLRDFVVHSRSRDVRRWNRILARACAVVTQCCEGAKLPVEDMGSPLQFQVPESYLKTCGLAPSSSSSKTSSRETTPDSADEEEDEEEEEEEDDDEEAFAEEEKETTKGGEDNVTSSDLSSVALRRLGRRRSVGELREEYKSLFKEMEEDGEVFSQRSNKKNNKNPTLDFGSRYLGNAASGLCGFVKVAYPDLTGAASPGSSNPGGNPGQPDPDSSLIKEPLNENDSHVYRIKMSQNIRNILGELPPYEKKVVYDLDQLIRNKNADPPPLSNDDACRVKSSFLHHPQPTAVVPALKFESRFESGNLRRALRSGEREYDLVLTPDANTGPSARHAQWFYFQVEGMEGDGEEYTFNIVNQEKANSQYNFGMQPLLLSVKESESSGCPQWRRAGKDVLYFKNHYAKPNGNSNTEGNSRRRYQTASFTISFPHSNDVCYLAYHFPYTYTRLMTFLDLLRSSPCDDAYLRQDELCETVRGNPVPVLTVTSSSPSAPQVKNRPVVFLTARVHPGETNASWAMEGTLDFLCRSTDIRAVELRSRFVFKIVPMLNVEGVVNGSHRCGPTGEDLNRRWAEPNPEAHPEVHRAKGMVEYLSRVKGRAPDLFVDYHGHSRKKNVFLYGCSPTQSWFPMDAKTFEDSKTYLQLEGALEKLDPCFDQKSCRYAVEKSRESTARVVLWREFKVSRSYTMETTFCGFNKRPLKGHQVSTCHLLSVGRSLSLAVLMLPLSQQDQQQQQSSLSNSIHQNRKQQHFQEAIIDLGSGNRISRKLPKRLVVSVP